MDEGDRNSFISSDPSGNSQGGDGRADSHLIQSPAIELPTGGGAIRGIDEKFQVNPATGTGNLSIPIATSPGRQGFGPRLAIQYDSGAGNGPFGLGWQLALPRITRKTDKGLPAYEDGTESDVFILTEAEDLVPVYRQDPDGTWVAAHPGFQRDMGGFWVRDPSGNLVVHEDEVDGYRVRRYRPRIESLFARIERWTDTATGETHWRSITRDNVTTLYGRTPESRIADPEDPLRAFSWLICESRDDRGNAILYRYQPEDSSSANRSAVHERNRSDRSRSANRYPKRIHYGNTTPARPGENLNERTDWLFEVVFDYGEGHFERIGEVGDDPRIVEATPERRTAWPVRLDPVSSYRAGFEVRTYRLCRRILMFHHFAEELPTESYLVRATHLDYQEDPIHTRLTGAVQSGYRHLESITFQERSLPPVEFDYSEAEVQSEVHEIDAASLENLPAGLSGSLYQWVDLDGEGISGILAEQGGSWYYKANLGDARFAPVEPAATKPAPAGIDGGQQLLDLAGDGQLDLVALDAPAPGYYERTPDRSWETHKPFGSLPSVDWRDPNLRFVDLTGDGHADVLITENEVLIWYPSLAEKGFDTDRRVSLPDDEETGPRLVFADPDQTVYLADLSGDGLSDLVRIRNGMICYWPSLGYGRFGAKVTMDDAPWLDAPDQFDPRRIRLADVDGSGIADLLYLRHDRVDIYFNQAGNAWAGAQSIFHFPTVDDLSGVSVVDLLGNGTACLVWSSPLPSQSGLSMRYIDLMGGTKPHLLVGTRNNLGAETRMQYTASTKFYLADKAAGKPWITRQPFPVHVVEQTETYDHISRNRFVTRYAYHHGYFDGIEREFRGFGLVEQFDTEEFALLNESDTFPTGNNIEASSHVPPVHTKTWFHTGVYLGHRRVSNFFAGLLDETDIGEYYREPGLSDEGAARLLLPDTVLPEGLSVEEEREACRALKGSMLRQEVYALDGSEKEQHPYTVAEQNFTIRTMQQKADNRHGVFFVHPREVLSFHYERNPADPRVSHTLTLAVDDFGNVLQSASVGYGRRSTDSGPTASDLTPNDRERQAQVLMTCTENAYTIAVDEDDHYRTPLTSETIAYELTGLNLIPDQARFAFAQLQEAVVSAEPIAYHQTPSGGLEKRVLEHTRTLYRPDDLGAAASDPMALLPPGVLESRALTGESYQMAFDPDHLERVFGDRVDEALLRDEGRYIQSEDGGWWIPSGRVILSPGLDDDAAQELAFARAHFFLPHRFRNPFDQSTTVTYDSRDLLVEATTDPVGNRVTARNDYRVLTPDRITDINGNRSEVAFDILGMVAGSAVAGSAGEGDRLEGFQSQPTLVQIDAFLADPLGPMARELLGTATSRILYDETRFDRQGEPAFAATIARETHLSDLVDGEETAIQVSLAYSDGFGRTVQNKIPAEPGPVPRRDDEGRIILGTGGRPEMTEGDVAPRWVGSGWTVFNNKGSPVRQYEPFFTDRHLFEFDVRIGVSPTLFYDPPGRAVATLNPDHTWEKVVFGPWQETRWDANDTVMSDPATDADVGSFFQRLPDQDYLPTWHALRTDPEHADAAAQRWPDARRRQDEAEAAAKTEAHADTPAVVHLDSLGRPFLSIADNGEEGRHFTRNMLDIEGAPLRLIDHRENVVMAYTVEAGGESPVPGYDVAGRQLYENSMDGGERWLLPDIGGKTIRSWDSRGHTFRNDYDPLQRPLRTFVLGADPEEPDRELLTERMVYGEQHPEAQELNLRGALYLLLDQAGTVTSDRYDFKGNLQRRTRRLAREYRQAIDWLTVDAVLPADPTALLDLAALDSALATFWEANATHTTETTYDAFNRPVTVTTPDRSVALPVYNEAIFLEQMAVRVRGADEATLFVADIDYDAKGQRTAITYVTRDGHNVTTSYTYDPDTFRMTRLHTVRQRDGRRLQDLSYVYDPVGNITAIRDNAQQMVFFNNTVVEPHGDYTYDAVYRLTRAEGREHADWHNTQRDAEDPAPVVGVPFPNSPEALQRYVETYAYDGVGNILNLTHSGRSTLRWKRCYQYAQDSNRLLGTSGGGEFRELPCPSHYTDGPESILSQRYTYDTNGNMTRMPHLSVMRWDFKDQLQATSRQSVDSGTPETTYYVYDGAGQRVRKVTERQAREGESPSRAHERVYLGGVEIYQEYAGNGSTMVLERQTLYVMDDQSRFVQIDTQISGDDGTTTQSRRFQLGNHLGSAVIEIDDEAHTISYEEFHPYGTSAYRAGRSAAEVGLKLYRYMGKQKDEETRLYYYGARYFAAWLGRWVSTDPSGILTNSNLYHFVSSNPVGLVDPDGRDDKPWTWLKSKATYLAKYQAGQLFGIGERVFETDYAIHKALTDPVGTAADVGKFVMQKYQEGEQSGGTVGGVANVYIEGNLAVNPLHQVISEGTAAVQAEERGDAFESGRHGVRTKFAILDTLTIVAGAAEEGIGAIHRASRASGLAVRDSVTNASKGIGVRTGTKGGGNPHGGGKSTVRTSPKSNDLALQNADDVTPPQGVTTLIDESIPGERYHVRDPANPKFFVYAYVENGTLRMDIRTSLATGERSALLVAPEQAAKVFSFFEGQFTQIKANWQSYSDNLATFNELTAKGMPPEKAATQTGFGRLFGFMGFKRAKIYDLQGKPGNYQSAQFHFQR